MAQLLWHLLDFADHNLYYSYKNIYRWEKLFLCVWNKLSLGQYLSDWQQAEITVFWQRTNVYSSGCAMCGNPFTYTSNCFKDLRLLLQFDANYFTTDNALTLSCQPVKAPHSVRPPIRFVCLIWGWGVVEADLALYFRCASPHHTWSTSSSSVPRPD